MSARGRKSASDDLDRFLDAVIDEDAEAVQELLDRGLPVDTRHPRNKQTLLLQAIDLGTMEIIDLLVGRGADLSAVDRTGTGVIGASVICNRPELVAYFAGRGADVNLRNTMGQSPLFHALGTADRRDSIIRVLLRYGADPDLADNGGNTPRSLARALKHIQDYSDLLPPKA